MAYFAGEFHLSSGYSGDLVKKETGKSALEYILGKLIVLAREKILDPEKSVCQIAYELGFKYPQYFRGCLKIR